MAISVNACLRFSSPAPPPPNPPSPISPQPTQVLFSTPDWRGKSIAAATAALMTFGMALAADATAIAAPADVRWSEKRECPPWRANSLENIMPENLPRPTPGQRTDGYASFGDAPAVAGGLRFRGYGNKCYSL